MRIINPKTTEVLESPFVSDAEAADRLKDRVNAGEWGTLDNGPTDKSEFPCSLLEAHSKSIKPRAKWPLSDGRKFWIHKLAMEGTARPEPEAAADLDFSSVMEMFETAGAKLKFPSINLTVPEDGTEIKVYRAGPKSKYSGSVMVVSPTYGGPYYGRITEGKFYRGKDCNEMVLDFLKSMEADPKSVAAAYGHVTGKCCFCRKKLTDDSSVEYGYGPVCAKNYGLVHSYTSKPAKRTAPVRELADVA